MWDGEIKLIYLTIIFDASQIGYVKLSGEQGKSFYLFCLDSRNGPSSILKAVRDRFIRRLSWEVILAAARMIPNISVGNCRRGPITLHRKEKTNFLGSFPTSTRHVPSLVSSPVFQTPIAAVGRQDVAGHNMDVVLNVPLWIFTTQKNKRNNVTLERWTLTVNLKSPLAANEKVPAAEWRRNYCMKLFSSSFIAHVTLS